MKVSCGSLFIYCGSYLTKPVPLTACTWVWAAALRPVSFRPVNLKETKGTDYERQKIFNINAGNQPNSGIAITVVGERGRKELPPGTKGGENLKPDRHYEHKQHAFDSYCKRSIKNEAMNAYTQLRKRSRREVSLSELPEDAMAQLAVYDRYSWEYTTFPVGGAVILIDDDRLAEALLALPRRTGTSL